MWETGSLADLLEEGVGVGVGDVPVVDDAGLLEPLLGLLERDEVPGRPGLPVPGEPVELAPEPGPSVPNFA